MPFDAAQGPDPFDDPDDWLSRWMCRHMTLRQMVQLYVAIERTRIVGQRPVDPRCSIKPWERPA